jgi:hypothetical protein
MHSGTFAFPRATVRLMRWLVQRCLSRKPALSEPGPECCLAWKAALMSALLLLHEKVVAHAGAASTHWRYVCAVRGYATVVLRVRAGALPAR